MKNRNLIIWYIILGITYILIKIVFISFGYLHKAAIFHGAVPCLLTVFAGLLSISKKVMKNKKQITFIIMLVFSALTLIITPIYMYVKAGEMWLTKGRLPVLILYELIAIVQIIISLKLLRIINQK